MNTTIRLGLAAAVVVVAVILGINYVSGPNVGNEPEGSSAPSNGSARPSPAARVRDLPLSVGVNTPLVGGDTYALTDFPVSITFVIPTYEAPAEWNECSEAVVEQNICFISAPDHIVQIGFLIVDNVVADPCGPEDVFVSPQVGPSVDDLVTAISNLEGFVATPPEDVTEDGFHGKLFRITAPPSPGPDCPGFATWATAQRTNGMGPEESDLLRILDVNGTRVVITATYSDLMPEPDIAVVEQFIASINIEP